MIKINVNYKSSVRILPSELNSFMVKHDLKLIPTRYGIDLINKTNGTKFGEIEL